MLYRQVQSGCKNEAAVLGGMVLQAEAEQIQYEELADAPLMICTE